MNSVFLKVYKHRCIQRKTEFKIVTNMDQHMINKVIYVETLQKCILSNVKCNQNVLPDAKSWDQRRIAHIF